MMKSSFLAYMMVVSVPLTENERSLSPQKSKLSGDSVVVADTSSLNLYFY